jgi:hypothetical protein
MSNVCIGSLYCVGSPAPLTRIDARPGLTGGASRRRYPAQNALCVVEIAAWTGAAEA